MSNIPIPKILTIDEYKSASVEFNIPLACIMAVAEMESRGAGFLSTGEPVILFERHKFDKFTKGKWRETDSEISNPVAGGYGSKSIQHAKLNRAVALDRNAALQSCSWGKFQVMGFNFRSSGYETIQYFVNSMYKSERDHLNAFLSFIAANRLDISLSNLDFKRFARGYNGREYYKTDYDGKLKMHYNSWVKKVGTR